MRFLAIVALASCVAACGDDGSPSDAATDGSGGADSSVPTDSSIPTDSPMRDTGPRRDAGGGPCSVPVAFDVGVTYETTLHVSQRGDDTSGDGSMGSPFATIGRAARAAGPGTQIRVGAGTYGPVGLGSLNGAEGRPIAIVADGDAIIDVGGAMEVGVSMSEFSWVVIEGLTIRNARIHGMNLDDGGSRDTPSHHLVLRNLTIPNAGSGGNNDCIKLSGVDDFWVLGSDVAGCNSGEAIDMVGCHNGVISGNYFHDTVGQGVQAKGGSSDTLIHGNRFANIPVRAVNAGGSTGIEFLRPADATWEGLRIRVVANTFTRGGEMGSPIAFDACDECSFVNNTVVEPQRWVVRILQGATDPRFVPSRNGLVANNVFVVQHSSIRAYFNVGPGTAPDTFTFANNLWYAHDQDSSWGGPTYTDGIPAGVDELVQMDPQMIDRAAGNYRLMSTSPARGAGRDPGFALPSDLDGACYAEPPTLGAFEIP